MAARVALTAILELEELKKDTAVTRSVISSAQQLLTMHEEGEVHIQRLMCKMRQIYRICEALPTSCYRERKIVGLVPPIFHRRGL